MALGLQNCQYRLKTVGLGGSAEKAAGKEHQDIPLTARQSRQVGAGYLHRGENGMVVRYLAVINDPFQLRRVVLSLPKGIFCHSHRAREPTVACISAVIYWLSVLG